MGQRPHPDTGEANPAVGKICQMVFKNDAAPVWRACAQDLAAMAERWRRFSASCAAASVMTGSISASTCGARWHLMKWPSRSSTIGGSSVSQRLPGTRCFQRQRVWNGQPGGGEIGGGNLALQQDALFLDRGVGDRHRRQQRLGIGMIGRREHVIGSPDLDDMAEIHHHHAVGRGSAPPTGRG